MAAKVLTLSQLNTQAVNLAHATAGHCQWWRHIQPPHQVKNLSEQTSLSDDANLGLLGLTVNRLRDSIQVILTRKSAGLWTANFTPTPASDWGVPPYHQMKSLGASASQRQQAAQHQQCEHGRFGHHSKRAGCSTNWF